MVKHLARNAGSVYAPSISYDGMLDCGDIAGKTQWSALKSREEQTSNGRSQNKRPRNQSTETMQSILNNNTGLYTEDEYTHMWNYYLQPVERKEDELPSGVMTLRRKKAMPNLLRFKYSLFRQQLYKKICRLERRGEKDEIYRMLNMLYEHDMSVNSGDGPRELVEQILPTRVADDDVKVSDGPFEKSTDDDEVGKFDKMSESADTYYIDEEMAMDTYSNVLVNEQSNPMDEVALQCCEPEHVSSAEFKGNPIRVFKLEIEHGKEGNVP